jgi:biopolymer transport protein ExbD
MLLLTACLAMLLPPAGRILRKWREVHTDTIVVRITSSGTVKFGNQTISIAAMRSHLDQSLRTARSDGRNAVLEVESYRNTPPDYVQQMVALGREMGFDEVLLRPLSWPDTLGNDGSP